MTQNIKQILHNTNISAVLSTSQTIKNILQSRSNPPTQNNTGVYAIPCTSCNKHYIGETSRDLTTRIHEHKRDIRVDDTRNACVTHRNTHNHIMQWEDAHIVAPEQNTRRRKCLESIIISRTETIKQNHGSYNIAPPLANLIIKERKILIPTHHITQQQPQDLRTTDR